MLRKLVPFAAIAASLTIPVLIGTPAADAAAAPSTAHAAQATFAGWPCNWNQCGKGDIFGYVEASPDAGVPQHDVDRGQSGHWQRL